MQEVQEINQQPSVMTTISGYALDMFIIAVVLFGIPALLCLIGVWAKLVFQFLDSFLDEEKS